MPETRITFNLSRPDRQVVAALVIQLGMVSDNRFTPLDSVATDANGRFSFTLPANVPVGANVQLRIKKGASWIPLVEGKPAELAKLRQVVLLSRPVNTGTGKRTVGIDESNLYTAVEVLNTRVAELDKERTGLTTQLATAQAEATRLQSKYDQMKNTAETLRQNLAARKQGMSISMEQLFAQPAQSATLAQKVLSQNRSDFRVGSVSMEIKGLIDENGSTVRFFDREELVEIPGEAFSSVKYTFHAIPPQPAAGEGTKVRVPSLLGYTETMARRKLMEVGLYSEFSYRTVELASQAGRVVEQDIQPNTEVAEGSVVRLGLGKPME